MQQIGNTVFNYSFEGSKPTTQEMGLVLDLELKRADVAFKFACADRELALAFQTKCTVILNGLAEIRWALGQHKIGDDSVPGSERIPYKSAFETEKQQEVLRVHYIQLLELYHKLADQLKIPPQPQPVANE